MPINLFVPTMVGPSEEARSGSPADAFLMAASPGSQQRQYAYERANENPNLSNPPFKFGISGRLNHAVATQRNATDPRILRGYIRRSVANDTADPTSKYRLYFMFNPSVIERQFVNYLDQQALDPFNTIFGSGNLVAPPSILDFSFEMFFDRQSETAADSSHPGVKVDFDYFDRVVRGVEPGAQGGGNEVSDNGVFLINPRSIKVVFSPELVIEGRPYSANVTYEKFDHRMTPTRIRIFLTMKVQYIGIDIDTPYGLFLPNTDVADHKATVAYEDTVEVKVNALANVDDLSFEVETPPAPDASATPAAAGVTGTAAGTAGPPIAGSGDGSLIWPCRGIVTTEFGANGHPGIDIAAPLGTPIYAAADGVVTDTNANGQQNPSGYGTEWLYIKHRDDLYTMYGHVQSRLVQPGQTVKQGQQIHTMGSQGMSTGSHLHLETRNAPYGGWGNLGNPTIKNPRDYIKGNPSP